MSFTHARLQVPTSTIYDTWKYMTGNNREQIALKVTFIMLLLRAFTARALLPSNLPRKPLAPCLLPSTTLTIRNTQPPQRPLGLQIPLRTFSSLFIFPVFQPP